MHVHVDLSGVYFDKENGQRKASDRQEGMIGLHDRVGQAAVFYIAPIDEQVDLGAAGAGEGRRADVTADADAGDGAGKSEGYRPP